MGTAVDVQRAPTGWRCPTCGRDNPAEYAVCPHDATPRTDQAKTAGDPLIGEVLNRTYKLVRPLGQGGMAKLYQAEHLRIDARYAVKVIHDDLAHDPSLLLRFEREARAAGKIHSPNVVQLVDVLRTADGRPCLVTELLEGEDLQTRLDRAGKLAVGEAIPIARQICQAAAAAHAVGVVHRDLKPSNVFLCPNGEVKVFDFGVAKLEGDDKLTRTESVMGTAAYMAPEQARRAADAGPLADVYSIGAVLYHMLTGEPPYGNVPALSRFALVLHEEPARPRTINAAIPEGVEAVIQHAMARDPIARAQSAMELDAQLAAFDRPPRAPLVTPVSGVPQPMPPSASTEMQAADIALRAKLTRPLAVLVALASSFAVGAWLAAMLALLFEPHSTGERALISIIGLAAFGGMVAMHVTTLRPRWRSTPAITRRMRSFTRALLAGVIALGALELFTYGTLAMFRAEPLKIGLRLAIAAAAAVLGLGWRAWKLDARVRRWIG
ncbi:MAG TPA: serine/threonine-protein kinase [Kofleriaceae bacterium]|nr:serine/threonine-protein kinase [Kofleriaceae bacterium]